MVDKKVTSKIKKTVRYVVNLLVNRDYDEIVLVTSGERLQAHHIKDAIREYGGTLVAPPEEVYDDSDILDFDEIENVSPQQWWVVFALWTKEEGRSDLSMELTLTDSDKDLLDIELDNIHVL